MGRETKLCPLDALEVRAGYAGRGGAEPGPFASAYFDSMFAGARSEVFLEGGDRSRSFSRTAGEGAVWAR